MPNPAKDRSPQPVLSSQKSSLAPVFKLRNGRVVSVAESCAVCNQIVFRFLHFVLKYKWKEENMNEERL